MESTQTISNLQKNGQITLPVAFRRKYNLTTGDPIVIKLTPEGLLISKNQSPSLEVLDLMREELEARGITLEELRKRSSAIRLKMVEQKYGKKTGTAKNLR